MSRLQELWEEFRMVFSGRGNVVDSIVPPVVFLGVNSVGRFDVALGAALLSAAAFSALRLMRRQPLRWAIGGLTGVIVAVLIARLLGRAEGFFASSLVTGSVTVVLCLGSILVRRPMVAWTSAIVRRWPWQWYWHPRVRPAYTEVTWLWAFYFGLRLFVQINLLRNESAELLGIISLVAGWPGIILLLIMSYIYGIWRLRQLQGPSVEEFQAGKESPWTSQRRGF
jgi:hypothetical protein